MIKFTVSFIKLILVCEILIQLTGCTSMQGVGLYSESRLNPLVVSHIDLNEEVHAEYYNIKKGDFSKNIVFFFSGTGCFSHKNYLEPYLKNLNDANIFALQKLGVNDFDMGFLCSQDFSKNDYFELWLSRQNKFINTILRDKANNAPNIVLMGVSEGANVAGAITLTNPKITQLVLISPLGKKMPDFLTEIGPSFGISEEVIKSALVDIAKLPNDTSKKFLGKSYKYWSSFAGYDPYKTLLEIDMPTLIGVGGLDINTPPNPVRTINNIKQAKGASNFRLIEYPDANHTLVGEQGVLYRPQFLERVNEFLSGR